MCSPPMADRAELRQQEGCREWLRAPGLHSPRSRVPGCFHPPPKNPTKVPHAGEPCSFFQTLSPKAHTANSTQAPEDLS